MKMNLMIFALLAFMMEVLTVAESDSHSLDDGFEDEMRAAIPRTTKLEQDFQLLKEKAKLRDQKWLYSMKAFDDRLMRRSH